jgi:transposase-like protein
MLAVRWYLRYDPSPREVAELLAERGTDVDDVTVYRGVQRFTLLPAGHARFSRHAPGDRCFVDERYVKVNGIWRYIDRAIDQYSQVIDVLFSTRRDGAVARRFSSCARVSRQVEEGAVVGVGREAVLGDVHVPADLVADDERICESAAIQLRRP